MTELRNALQKEALVYVTRDLERANSYFESGYYIITNKSDFARGSHENPNIFFIENKKILDTHELLKHDETKAILKKLKNFKIVVFKNTRLIEGICRTEGWTLVNPPSELSERVEEKISQVEWLCGLEKHLPKSAILTGKELEWKSKPFILQFNRSHSGKGTILIDSKTKLKEIKAEFPDRPVRVTEYILGPTFTNNNVIWGDRILPGSIGYQITGLHPFTDNPFTTIGNDWELPKNILSADQVKNYHEIVRDIGTKLLSEGWKGLFGIDVILDNSTGKLYLIEVNARQPASTTYESELQKKNGEGVTTFEAHLSALLQLPCKVKSLAEITGAQIIKRITNEPVRPSAAESLEKLGLKVIHYSNTEKEKELLRIQSEKGIMSAHNSFNDLGQNIARSI